MASASASTRTLIQSKKFLPGLISDLLDLAIYSFSCQSGLRAFHKIRGDPVLEGVASMLGRMLSASNAETQAAFDEITPTRLGNWRPGQMPTKELLTLISSRIKNHKTKAVIREDKNPVVPALLIEKNEFFSEQEDRVKTQLHAICWRCGQRCQFCLARKQHFPKFGNFSMEIASPFLDVLEELLDDGEEDDNDDDSDSEKQESAASEDDDSVDDDSVDLLHQCMSDIDFPESEEEENNGDEADGEDAGDAGDAMDEDYSSDYEPVISDGSN